MNPILYSPDVIVMRTEAEDVVVIVEGVVENEEIEIGTGETVKMLTPPLPSIMTSLTALCAEQLLFLIKLRTWSPTSRASPAPRPRSRLLPVKISLSPGPTGAEPRQLPLRNFLAYQVCKSNNQLDEYR